MLINFSISEQLNLESYNNCKMTDFKLINFIVCVWVLTEDLFTICVQCSQRPEEGLDPPEIGLQTLVSCHVGARNQTWVLCKSNKCS